MSTLLQEHGDALEPVGDLARDRRQVDAAHLLEVGELRDLHAVEQHLPADAPGAQRRRLPVVFLEADVVLARVDAARLEAVQVRLLHLVRRRLQDHLELVVLEQPVRVLAEAAVVGPPRRLHVGHAPGLRARARGTAFRGATVPAPTSRSSGCCSRQPCDGPERRELEDEILEGHAGVPCQAWRRRSRSTRSDFNVFSRCIEMSARCTFSISRHTRLSPGSEPTSCGATLRAADRNATAPCRQGAALVGIQPLEAQQPELEDTAPAVRPVHRADSASSMAAPMTEQPIVGVRFLAPTRRGVRAKYSTQPSASCGAVGAVCRPRHPQWLARPANCSGDRTISA